MDILWIIILTLVGFVLLLIHLARRDAEYFRSRGVLYLWNGNYRMVLGMFKGTELIQHSLDMYNTVKRNNKKIAGMKEFGMITLVVLDPELIKHILVKDFDHFTDRRLIRIPKLDKLFGKMLFTQKGDTWKALRSKLSPAFTTGKIKRMFQIMKQSVDRFVAFLEKGATGSDGGEVELSEAFSKMMMDVIASAACGIDSKAFESKEQSLFEQMGNKVRFQFGPLQILKFLLVTTLPILADILGMTVFGNEVQSFFSGAVKLSIRHREAKREKRDDFIQLMLESRSNQLKADEEEIGQFEKDVTLKITSTEEGSYHLDDESIVANCVNFINGGFETTHSLLVFLAYALALNPEVQVKLRVEVDEILEEHDGELTYDGVEKMEYLDMVINETLRCYPPLATTDRMCMKDYKIPGTDFVLKKGEGVMISIMGLHHDEQYWPEPQKFIPERFSPENKGKINQYAFMPFGHGPRNCIGIRFAFIEVKLAISNLVRNFTVEPSKRTLIPMKYSNTGILQPEGGLWLAIHKRNP